MIGGEGIGLAKMNEARLLGSRTRKPVSPRTQNQFDYLQAMNSHPVVFGLGPAGTGKTYLAMAMALSRLKKGEIARVVLTRPAVEAGEALGFLPGDLQEKVAPYLRPLYDALHDILEPEEGHRYLEDGTIEIAPLAYMRGRTLAHSSVILDEAQNTTREQMFMLLTRLGEGSFLRGDGGFNPGGSRRGESFRPDRGGAGPGRGYGCKNHSFFTRRCGSASGCGGNN